MIEARSPADAPGAPGIDPTWSSSSKDVVGCSLGPSRLWFTMGYGIVNEVYSPRIDIPQIRDLGFIVADDEGFWVEVKRMESYRTTLAGAGVPAVEIVHDHPRFELRLRVVTDRLRPVLLLETKLTGDEGLRPYLLLAPHVGGTGHSNVAEIFSRGAHRILGADQGPFGVAIAARSASSGEDGLYRCSAGYVGASDGWQDFAQNGKLTWQHERAGPGNVALIGELCESSVLALAVGSSSTSAATLALSALQEDFDETWTEEVRRWTRWHDTGRKRAELEKVVPEEPLCTVFHTSAMVLKVHQDKTFPGALVASLSVPWGNARDDIGGYHLVWPRDLVESAGALLALGARREAEDILWYLIATQKPDGSWHQNQWLGGTPYWSGVQLDEAGFPVLLASALAQEGALEGSEVVEMVRRALRFISMEGPASDQDRWEEDRGVNAFTLAVSIAALVSGAELLDGKDRQIGLELADFWNSRIEDWTTVAGTDLSRQVGVERYFVRVAPPMVIEERDALQHVLAIKNHTRDPALPAEEQVGVDFLQLVRFGLRKADDPIVEDTVKLVDQLLKVDTPSGAAWHRYNGDGYGEHEDGSPFDGAGRGRAWPLLAGERGHYELARGGDPRPYLEAMAAMTSSGGMIPEQVWDTDPIRERFLFPGRPTGSAMPLVWAHAEYVKLVSSMKLGRPFDRPEPVWKRYEAECPDATVAFWTPKAPLGEASRGMGLSLLLPAPAVVHWGRDDWEEPQDASTTGGGLGLHRFDFPEAALSGSSSLVFTLRWEETGEWEGQDYHVSIVDSVEPTRTD